MTTARILIVDDEFNTREAMARYLKTKYLVSTAGDGAQAIEMLQNGDFDLVLTDLKMPNMDGFSVLDATMSKARKIPCILLTAYGSIADAVNAVKKGAFDFVAKPVKLEKLEEVIEAALQSAPTAADTPAPAAAELSGALPELADDDPMRGVLQLVGTVAPGRANILLTGESGTGKEVIAKKIHDLSGRKGFFIPVHCAALSANLLESELFGHEKGAFTGAVDQRKGRFELADGGTLFLDEIGEIDPLTQVKLLRVLETRSFERVGGVQSIRVDARLIAATNRDLKQMVAEGKFREDLYYRLSVININLPPLRDRKGEIPGLIDIFIREFAAENNRIVQSIAPEALKILLDYRWPGNIRELRNTIEYMVVVSQGETLTTANIPAAITQNPPPEHPESVNIEDNERNLIIRALDECGQNRTLAAQKLGISRRTLQRKIHEFHLN